MAQCVEFAEQWGLLQQTRICKQHKRPMYLDTSRGQFGGFRCRGNFCKNKYISRAKGTWFENAHLPLPLIFKVMHCFCINSSYAQTQLQMSAYDRSTAVSSKTIADWFSYCREVVILYHLDHQIDREKIGGPQCIVQIDESKFDKRTYYRGRQTRQVEGQWLIGMIADGSDDLRLQICPDHLPTSEGLIPLIQEHVAEGTTIHTDSWRAYDGLTAHGYEHRKCNKSDPENRFVESDDTDTERIQSGWNVFKRRFNKENYKGDFTSWLVEYSWRRHAELNHLEIYEELLKAIRYVYRQS